MKESEQVEPVELLYDVTRTQFLLQHVLSSEPVIIVDAMAGWRLLAWDKRGVRDRFGRRTIQVCDDRLRLITLTALDTYLTAYWDTAKSTELVPTACWYTKADARRNLPWADDAFESIASDWAMPYFLPVDDYVLPYIPIGADADVTRVAYPGKALLFSGQGARTECHGGSLRTDQILCQVFGRKRVRLWQPVRRHRRSQRHFARRFTEYPSQMRAGPSSECIIGPGETLFVPGGWTYQVDTLEDSLSMTWKFVLGPSWPRLARDLGNMPTDDDWDVVDYFVTRSPHAHRARPLPRTGRNHEGAQA
jgi:hypothetical protein